MYFLLFAFGLVSALAQNATGGASDLGEPFGLSNSSFEDVPRQGHAPRGWYDCGFPGESPVDVHPAAVTAEDTANFFGVDILARDGNTYLGMVVRDNDTYEAVSQRLNGGALVAGQCYSFSIYLARETGYFSSSKTTNEPVNYETPAKLRIFGGSSYCNRGEVIAESAPVENAEWLQYNFRFEPKRDHAYLVLEAYYKTPVLFPYNGNLLVDMAGLIEPIACDEEVLAEADPEEPLAESDYYDPGIPEADPPAAPEAGPPADAVAAVPITPEPPAASTSKLQGVSRNQLKPGSVVRVDKLYFKADSSALTPVSMPVLEEIYTFLKENDDVVIEVGGHTNNIPPDDFCDWLSTERAEAVVEYLVSKGIDPKRLFAKGYGKRNPVATNRTPTGRRRNQRVELKVLSMG